MCPDFVSAGHTQPATGYMNAQLQHYFEFVAAVWHSFAPSELKDRFPRSFKFPVTVPHTFLGELPQELNEIRQLEVQISEDEKGDKNATGKDRKN